MTHDTDFPAACRGDKAMGDYSQHPVAPPTGLPSAVAKFDTSMSNLYQGGEAQLSPQGPPGVHTPGVVKNKIPIIDVQNLEARYGDRVVLDCLNFKVLPGEIFMIIGGSGCGKTTLLNHMIGLLTPYGGDILLDGQNIARTSDRKRLPILRKIGVLYQNGALFGSMNLLQNVALPLEELTKLPQDAILEIAHNKLKMVGLENFALHMPAQISGGMQKRAAIARAMALDPKVLFLDEPTSGLDPISSSEIDQLVVNLSKILGITFVIISHDLSSIRQIAMRVILLYKGKIIAEGEPQQLSASSDYMVKKFFSSRSMVD